MHPIIGTFFTLVCLTSLTDLGGGTTDPLEQEPGAVVKTPPDEKKDPVLSGRIVDGLGRPLSRVNIKVMTPGSNQTETWDDILSGEDGRFSLSIPKEYEKEFEKVDLGLQKANYVYLSAKASVSRAAEYTMHRKIDWEKLDDLPWKEGEELEQGVREVLASEVGSDSNLTGIQKYESNIDYADILFLFIFRYHESLRPAMRQLTKDPHVGGAARNWLDVLGYPDDRDLIPEGRRFPPKHEIGEEDLVEAIKAISRRLNFFSDAPEPMIDISSITFTPEMDRALVRCGINLSPLSGVLWRFVFHKEGKRWVLRSMAEVGRH